nr:Protein FAM133B like [Ipomoea batatas]
MFCRCADIATGYRNNVFAVTSQKLFCNTRFVYGKDTGFPSSRRSFCIPGEAKGLGGVKLRRGGLMIRAVVTFQEVVTKSNQSSEKGCYEQYEGCVKLSIESRSLECTAMEQQSETGNSTELDESVRMKLANLGHAQSGETRMKIGASMQLNWEKRRKKLMLQETCYFEWQNLLAEASRNGLFGEEELQWDSYKILNEQLEQEWLQSIQQRKEKPKGSKNQPKSAEQRRKISEAIAAKWADPLEMLKNIRTQRAAIDNKKDEALARAKLLIAEAEKAAKALEIAATKEPYIGDVYSVENGTEHSLTPTEPATVDDMTLTKLETLEEVDQRKSNRAHALLPNGVMAFTTQLAERKKLGLTFSSNMAPLAADTRLKKLDTAEVDSDCKRSEAEEDEQKPWPNGFTSQPTGNQPLAKPTSVSKKWVRGRFVEAGEEERNQDVFELDSGTGILVPCTADRLDALSAISRSPPRRRKDHAIAATCALSLPTTFSVSQLPSLHLFLSPIKEREELCGMSSPLVEKSGDKPFRIDGESSANSVSDQRQELDLHPPPTAPKDKPIGSNIELAIDFATTKMSNQWSNLEKAPAGSLKSKIHGLGLRLLSRVKPSEIFLKSISKEGSEKLLELVTDCPNKQNFNEKTANENRSMKANSKENCNNLRSPWVLVPSEELQKLVNLGDAADGLSESTISAICQRYNLNLMDVVKYRHSL